MIFEIFRYNSQNFLKYFSKIFDLFLEIILRNFLKYFSKVSEVFLKISEFFLENFKTIFEIFLNNFPNFPKYFSKCYEIILKILLNNYRIKSFGSFLLFKTAFPVGNNLDYFY